MHIAIIGAGISGLLSALELVEQGCHVSIFDQQEIGKAASWAGGGILSPMYPWRYAPAVNQLAKHGKTLYQEWNEKLLPHTAIDFQIHETGMLIFDEEDFELGLNYQQQFHEPLQHCEYLQQEQLENINPLVSAQFQHAIYFPEIANIRNPRVLQSLTQYLKQHPLVHFFEDHAIQKFHYTHGRIQSIQSKQGLKFQADQFIITTGAWSGQWSEQLNLHIPVEPVQGQMLLFKTPPNWLPTMCMNKVMYLIPRSDGHIVCGSSVAHVGFNTTPTQQTKQDILTACFEMIPELEQFEIVNHWAGLRPSSPTGIPYIGLMPEFENLWANFGHYRNGLCMGPASAQLLRQLILKQDTFLDAQAYSPQSLKHPIKS